MDHVSEIGRESGAAGAPRHGRRLSDKILVAFHQACDQRDFEVAERLLQVVEILLAQRPLAAGADRRRHVESLIAAHHRLWHLQHPDTGEL